MTVRFSRRALTHLAHIRAYIREQRPAAAELVRGRIIASIETLQELPQLGRPGQRKGTRELGVAGLPYIIVYRADAEQLVILGIFHGAQDR